MPNLKNSSCIARPLRVVYAPSLVSQKSKHNSPELIMFHKPVSGLAGIALVLVCAAVAHCQDFHVSTRIYDLRNAPPAGNKNQPPPPQLCESLFHAGKVYDFND